MKNKILMIISLLLILFLTGCDINLELPNQDESTKGCHGGWKENGQCCKAEYSGYEVDAEGNCQGTQKPGSQIGHKTRKDSCYHLVCETINPE